MENNIENQLKNHFHNREIKPNPVLWDVLESKLDAQKHQRKIHIYKWLAYASIFVGILFASALFFERNKTVGAENFTTKESSLPQIKNPKIQKSPTTFSDEELTNSTYRQYEKKSADKIIKIKKKPILSNKKGMAQQVFLKKKEKAQAIQNIVKQENEVVKHQAKKHIKPSSDADLDALLVSTLSTMNQKDTTVRKISIETNQVLSVLDNEINIPFKNRIIKSLIAGVQAVDNHLKNN